MRQAIRACLLLGCALALVSPASAQTAERVSTVADRDEVNVTVYNGGMSLVHDRRRIDVAEGVNRIAWRDVSATIDATSTLLDAVDPLTQISMIEQNFDYDLLDPLELLYKYVGRDVVVVHEERGGRKVQETARVLSVSDGVVLRYRDHIETGIRGYIVYPSLPPGFRDRPTLVLDFESNRTGPQQLDLSYLTGGLSWRADYVGSVSADETHMNLTGIVTLNNQSGSSYDDARLQLVAGNVNVAAQGTLVKAGTTADVYSVNASSAPAVRQEDYFEYHLYTLQHPTTILDKQTKQITMLSARNVPIHKTLELRGSPDYYRGEEADLGDRIPVGVYVTFTNKDGDLGIPLPAGVVRLYKDDSRGLSLFLGAGTIDHTPRNEDVRMHVGDSFDVTARKKQTSFAFAGNCSADSAYHIVLSNAKDAGQDVLVVEPIPAQWQITSENLPHATSSASTASWNVYVPAGGRATLDYTARVTWC